ncbi:MAG: hypothetical protein EBT70_13425 [Betaproteobacteria bacterium]|nr:hypothetical protein [Betaproteobacteria bacterium]
MVSWVWVLMAWVAVITALAYVVARAGGTVYPLAPKLCNAVDLPLEILDTALSITCDTAAKLFAASLLEPETADFILSKRVTAWVAGLPVDEAANSANMVAYNILPLISPDSD